MVTCQRCLEVVGFAHACPVPVAPLAAAPGDPPDEPREAARVVRRGRYARPARPLVRCCARCRAPVRSEWRTDRPDEFLCGACAARLPPPADEREVML